MVDENELRHKLQELEILKNQMDVNIKSANDMELGMAEKEKVNDALDALIKMDTANPIMMELGDGTYLSLNLVDKDRALTSIGTGLFVRTDMGKVIEKNKKDVGQMRKDLDQLISNSSKIENKVRELTIQVQKEYLELQKQAAQESKGT